MPCRLTLSLLFLVLSLIGVAAATERLDGDVVMKAKGMTVRVVADTTRRERRVGSGFVWPDAGHVVTALHVVAGTHDVIVEYPVEDKFEERRARVERILKSADLALLAVDDPLDRPAATIAPEIEHQAQVWVVGFPFGTGLLSRALEISDIAPKKLGSGLEDVTKGDLELLGFPSLGQVVVRLDGTLVPGDSGAPIVDAMGRLVAIGDGGLRGGSVGLGWGLPASELSGLLASKQPEMPSDPALLSLMHDLFMYSERPRNPSSPDTVSSFRTSFEAVTASSATGAISGFVPSEPVFEPCEPLSAAYTSWALTEQAKSGHYAINVIPGGNPRTERATTNYCSSPTLAVSGAVLDKTFDTEGARNLLLSFFRLTTSNPRPSSVHNCDSSLNIFVSRQLGEWSHYGAVCGEYLSESKGWEEMRFKIPTLGANSMRLGFLYEVQNVATANTNAVYLIDDFDVQMER